jgi:hypothetical protein
MKFEAACLRISRSEMLHIAGALQYPEQTAAAVYPWMKTWCVYTTKCLKKLHFDGVERRRENNVSVV